MIAIWPLLLGITSGIIAICFYELFNKALNRSGTALKQPRVVHQSGPNYHCYYTKGGSALFAVPLSRRVAAHIFDLVDCEYFTFSYEDEVERFFFRNIKKTAAGKEKLTLYEGRAGDYLVQDAPGEYRIYKRAEFEALCDSKSLQYNNSVGDEEYV